MFTKLRIQQFKCFSDQEIEFGKITILAGANGVGKSSLIQSLLLIKRCLDTSEGTQIALNDKKNTFLELGSANEVYNISGDNSNIITFELTRNYGNDKATIKLEKQENITTNLKYIEYSQVLQLSRIRSLFRNFHYLNAERLGPRNIQGISIDDFISTGFQGEYTGEAIAKTSNIPLQDNKLNPEKEERSVLRQIEAWMQFIIPDLEIQITPFPQINQIRIGLRKKGSGTDYLHPNNIGFGISYVLPIVVSCLIAKEESIFVVENPEAHLHPLGQSRIGQFLAIMANAGVKTIVETHSEHVINGIRIASLKNKINHKDILIHFFTQNQKSEVEIKKIEINEKGELSEWAEGFFDQEEKDLSEIFRLTRKPR